MGKRLGRALASLTATMVVAGGISAGFAAPAHADEPTGTASEVYTATNSAGLHVDADGYYPLRDKTFYMAPAIGIAQIEGQNSTGAFLHLGPDDIDGQGFWFAARVAKDSFFPRGISWVHVRYGVKCTTDTRGLTFNPWLNRYSCPIRANVLAGSDVTNTQNCISASGRPWQYAAGSAQCRDGYLNPEEVQYSTKAVAGTGQCGPGEPTGLNAQGTNACEAVTYPWITSPDPVPFLAGPDACTGLPVTTNTGRGAGWAQNNVGQWYWDGDSSLTSNVPGCKGQDNAPNCTSVTSASPACGGPVETTPMVPIVGSAPEPTATSVRTSASASVTGPATEMEVSGSATRSAEFSRGQVSAVARQAVSKRVKVYQVKKHGKWKTVKASAYKKAKRKHQKVRTQKKTVRTTLSATGVGAIVVTRNVSRTVNKTVSVPSMEYLATEFASGSAYGAAYADALVAAKAAAEQKAAAGTGATSSSGDSLVETTRSQATSEASSQALAAAQVSARTDTATAAETAAARARAASAARAALAKQVSVWLRTG